MKESFLIYTAHYSAIKGMTQEQKGDLLDALFMYAEEDEQPEIADPMVGMAFAFMKSSLDRNSQKYEERCQRLRENAKKRWRQGADKEGVIDADDARAEVADNSSAKDAIADKGKQKDAKDAIASNCMQLHKKDAKACKRMLNDNDNDNDKHKDTNVSYEFIDNNIHTNVCLSIPENPEIDAKAHKGLSEGKRDGKATIDYTAIMDYWNAQADRTKSPMRRVTKMTPVRKAVVRARVTDNDGDVSAVFKAIDMAMRSGYMNGRGKEGWVATFDWMMNPKNFQSVMEGAYTDEPVKGVKKSEAAAVTVDVESPKPKSAEELEQECRRLEEQKKAEAAMKQEKFKQRMREYMTGAVKSPNGPLSKIVKMKIEDGTLEQLGLLDEWHRMNGKK